MNKCMLCELPCEEPTNPSLLGSINGDNVKGYLYQLCIELLMTDSNEFWELVREKGLIGDR